MKFTYGSEELEHGTVLLGLFFNVYKGGDMFLRNIG
jgi:hypothetical protein